MTSLSTLADRFFTPDVTDVARTQHEASPFRAPIAVVLGALSAPTLGPALAGGWVAVLLACELWTWVATRAAAHRALTRKEMIVYALSGLATLPTWASLGVLYWVAGGPQGGCIAVAAWTGQLLYTQRLVFQSYAGVIVGNAVIVSMMVATPLLRPRTGFSDTVVLEGLVLVSVALAINASITARKRIKSLGEQNRQIEHQALHDSLTGLPNRKCFGDLLDAALAAEERVGVLYMDLDRFKQVNDTFGHQAGDALLIQFGRRLADACPPGMKLARFGGDEFAVLVGPDQASIEGLERLCRQVIAAIAPPFQLPIGHAYVGLSVGVATAHGGGRRSEELMREADIALYAVKASGRNNFRLFSAELDAEIRDRAELETALRDALETREGLSLAYQPKVGRSGRVKGVEALLRWTWNGHPVAPIRCISVAEETGLILPLGAWVLREAVAFAQRWSDLSVAVNVSPHQLRDPTFPQFVIATVREAGVDPNRIELEITETALFEAADTAATALIQLRSAGLRVALDDFGTGFSSMRHLHRLPVDRVKIDKSFIDELATSRESAAIVQATIQLAHAMGLQVTAEGVEEVAQRTLLLEAGSDELQGYLISRPLSEADLVRFMDDARPSETKAA